MSQKCDCSSEEQAGFMYMVHHVFFPAQLPDEDDRNAGFESQLLSTLQDCLDNFGSQIAPHHIAPVASVAAMVRHMRDIRARDGNIDEFELKKTLCKICDSKQAVAIHVVRQNAGVIISMLDDSVRIESFELSPLNQAVMESSGRLRRQFPDVAVVMTLTKFRDPNFQATFVMTLSKLCQQSTPDTRPVVRKAGQPHAEERDTIDPRYVTEWLMSAFLGPISEPVGGQGIWKNTRDEIMWKDSFMPWRRSPTWILARAAMQLIFSRESSGADALYKSFMLFFMAWILNKTPAAHVSSDLVQIMTTKIARRKRKLAQLCTQPNQNVINYADSCMIKAADELACRQKLLFQQTTPADHLPRLESLNFTQDVFHSLPGMDNFLESMKERKQPLCQASFDRSECPAEFQPSILPDLSAGSPSYITFTLAAFEKWVADHLDKWILTHIADSDSCDKLAALMYRYQDLASSEYDKNPEGVSILILTVVELWIACDRSATHINPLLCEYDPQVPTQLLQSLLLPFHEQMVRLQEVERYLADRQRAADSFLPSIFHSFGSSQSFSVRCFQRYWRYQIVFRRITNHATEQRNAKTAELARLQEIYKSLKTSYDSSNCTYSNTWSWRYERYVLEHDGNCYK